MTTTVFSFFLPHNKSRTNLFLIFKNPKVHIRTFPVSNTTNQISIKEAITMYTIVHVHMNIYLQSFRVVIFRNSWVLGFLQRNIFHCLGHILEEGKIIQNLSRKDFICIMSRIMGDGFCCVINQALLVLSIFLLN